jgi:RHS repeat-associated protein
MKRLVLVSYLCACVSALGHAPVPKLSLAASTLVLQERDNLNVPQITYTRGPDLSGTRQGPGGMLARYHYDPFGNELSRSGPLANANVYRFSRKEWHLQSGLYYYGARFYEPGLQRWFNRDPLGEGGGLNLYGFVGNDPVNGIDPYGLLRWRDFNPALLFDAEAWGGLLHSWVVGDEPSRLDPNSFQAMRNAEGLAPGVFEDAQGNRMSGGQLTACVGGAVIAGTLAAMAEGAGNLGKCGKLPKPPKKKPTYLYQKVGPQGEHLKFGISENPVTRYTQEELAGGRLKIIGQGERTEMLRLERQLHETLPIGPEEAQKFYIEKQIEKGLKPPPYNP